MLRDTLSFSLLRLSATDLSFDSVLKGILVKHSQDFHWKHGPPTQILHRFCSFFSWRTSAYTVTYFFLLSLDLQNSFLARFHFFLEEKIKLWVKFFENNNNFLTEESCTVRLWYLQNREDFWERFKATLPRRNSNLRREMDKAPSVNKSLTTLDVSLPDFWSVTFIAWLH